MSHTNKNSNKRKLVLSTQVAVKLSLVVITLFLFGCDSGPVSKEINFSARITDDEARSLAPTSKANDVFLFGFDLRSSPQEDARQYLPFLKYLEKATGYRFELHFTPSDGEIGESLVKERVQFAIIGAGTYIKTRQVNKNKVIALVHGLNPKDKGEYQSMIVVHPKSKIKNIENLRNKRFAFGSVESTQGHLIPRIMLYQRGISLQDLAHYEYTGSHFNCANAVASGRFDACGMQDTMAIELSRKGLIRILEKSDYYPSSGIAASGSLDREVIDKVKKALLDFRPKGQHASELYHWDKTEMPNGFAEAHEKDYDDLEEWAARLGFIRSQGTEGS